MANQSIFEKACLAGEGEAVVHQGDLLVEIDPRPYQAALAQAEGQLTKDQATLLNAKITIARIKPCTSRG